MKYVYPAIFVPEDENYNVTVPDLPGCFTFGTSIPDAIYMARDAISLWLCDAEDNKEPIPAASSLEALNIDKGFVNLIDVDTLEYRRINDSKAIKKTLSIPSYLNSIAEREGVNFSAVLQDALKERLGLQ